ncbi:MAG: hypothetical protein LBG26_04955 [Treponema sp.]|jgi:type 1 fimbria pilin|nr:hypothetical protein [Treponema sp.]
MKNKLVLLAVCCVVGLSITGCGNDTSGTTPVVSSLVASDSTDNLDNGIAKTDFTDGQTVYVGVDVYDPDRDLASINVILTHNGSSSPFDTAPPANAWCRGGIQHTDKSF